ncbi:uncharacterized protein LOC132707300 isoform X2 [Cylas formicarius]|uniref:uncharacterized protein LOC132707300 isoform X2 n=1 Tax=Cylas formicarius TaxID=197179 RepID=UPI002958BC64|nr:uncharacterized protein LOC132707300 isoform X2 [Cylas formicarius]
MEEAFTKVVSHVFNNWTALRLAVEHSTGGPNSKQTALECLHYMVQFCLNEPNIQPEGIQEALEDILDEEFETICEDDSPKQIAAVLYTFLMLLKDGRFEECENEYEKLPTANADWLNQQIKTQNLMVQETSSESEEDALENAEMEQDGWKEVKSRRDKENVQL